MTTSSKRHKRFTSDTSPSVNNNDSYDLVTDHNFIAPFEICQTGIGLLSILMNRTIIDISFSKLYQQSLKLGWEKIFLQERQKLKPNDISVLKCFVLNRLLNEYSKDKDVFVQQTKTLYNEIKSRMVREFPEWTSKSLFNEVRRWQDIQCRRRLFYFNHQEVGQLPGLLMLQKAATNWCYCLVNYCKQNKKYWETEGRQCLAEHFQNSFIIVAQPTGSDGAAVTQYTKNTSGHSARLNSRIICLLDPDILKDCIELSNIDVILYPLNRITNDKKEEQPSIKWEIRKVMSADGVLVPVYSAEIHTLQLEKFDSVCKRLSLNSTICQLEFRMKIKVKDLEFEENITLMSQPFGICSHGQYFPKFVAQIFLYEMKQILNNDNQITDPDIITEFIRRYYTRMTGIEPTDHTNRYIRDIFAKAIDDVKSTRSINTLDNIYEDILAKIISQIDFMVLHPILSLMYLDSLFLGISNNTEVDVMLNGTREQPHMLLRFNSLTNHQWNANAIVQFIIHDGSLKKASFDMKTFANEMCRFICESMGDKTKPAVVLSAMSPRQFTDYQWYFHDELYRLNKMAPPSKNSYDPLLPILWMTMRQNNAVQTDNISNSTTHRRKRSHSDSFPVIESVSSVSQLTTMNIVVHFDNIHNFHCSTLSNSITDHSSTVVEKPDQLNEQESTPNNRQFLIEVPGNIDISPAVLFRYLGEKFTNISNCQIGDASSDYLIRPKQTIIPLSNTADLEDSEHMKSSFDHSSDKSNSSSEISKVESGALTDVVYKDTSNQLQIKEEPHDVDYAILNSNM